jgi:hypothetical protein
VKDRAANGRSQQTTNSWHHLEAIKSETSKAGRRGTVIPAALRRRFGIEEGYLVVVEATQHARIFGTDGVAVTGMPCITVQHGPR